MSLFLSIGVLVFAVLGHGYFWTDQVNRLHACSAPRKYVDALSYVCFAFFLAMPLLILVNWSEVAILGLPSSRRDSKWLYGYYLFCAAWGVYAFGRNKIYEFLTDSPKVLVGHQREVVDTQEFDRTGLFQPGFPKFLSTVPANQILQLTIDRKQLAIPELSAKHEGLTIAHISDLHMTGRIGREWYQLIAEQVNDLNADAIVITGDIVEKEPCWPWLAESLGKLRAECGVYYVLGNHDYYLDTGETRRLLQECGLVFVGDRCLEYTWNGAPVQLAGNELPWGAQPADLSSLPARNEEGLPTRIVLLHSPDQLQWACNQQAHLALAGHTHGGQLRFPIIGPIVSPSFSGTRYTCGVFRRGQTVMHVSRGITGKTPLRWNCPPEIALLELVRG